MPSGLINSPLTFKSNFFFVNVITAVELILAGILCVCRCDATVVLGDLVNEGYRRGVTFSSHHQSSLKQFHKKVAVRIVTGTRERGGLLSKIYFHT